MALTEDNKGASEMSENDPSNTYELQEASVQKKCTEEVKVVSETSDCSALSQQLMEREPHGSKLQSRFAGMPIKIIWLWWIILLLLGFFESITYLQRRLHVLPIAFTSILRDTFSPVKWHQSTAAVVVTNSHVSFSSMIFNSWLLSATIGRMEDFRTQLLSHSV